MEPFIDTHAHLIHDVDWKLMDEIAALGVLQQAWLMHCPAVSDGITFADEDEVLLCADRFPGLYVPFGFIDFSKGSDEVERLHAKGFKGLKAISPLKAYDDESFFPVYAKAEELGMPVLFHVGIIAKGFWKQMSVCGFPGPGNMKPSMLDTIADAFPKLQLIQGHQGVPWTNELFESLFYYPNISCSVCGLIDYEWLIRNLDRRTAFGQTFAQRMMFGVDGLYGSRPFWQNMLDSAGFMEEFFKRVGRTFHWGQSGRDFMSGNAEKFFCKPDTI
jgi:predicted TIM-barrel fold metal-dependent hydrolase